MNPSYAPIFLINSNRSLDLHRVKVWKSKAVRNYSNNTTNHAQPKLTWYGYNMSSWTNYKTYLNSNFHPLCFIQKLYRYANVAHDVSFMCIQSNPLGELLREVGRLEPSGKAKQQAANRRRRFVESGSAAIASVRQCPVGMRLWESTLRCEMRRLLLEVASRMREWNETGWTETSTSLC